MNRTKIMNIRRIKKKQKTNKQSNKQKQKMQAQAYKNVRIRRYKVKPWAY